MTTAIYARISDDRADGAGVARQLADCRALAKRRTWRVNASHEYVDNSITASKSGVRRPAYQAMLAAAQAGDVDRIVCYMIDRLYRQPRELEDLIDLAIAGRVEVVTAHGGEAIDLSSIDGATMARVSVAFAAGESRKISARVKRQQADRRSKGLHHGAARPMGYERVDGRLVPKPDEVALITAAMHSICGGMSLVDVAREWTRLGVPHPQHSRNAGVGVVVYPWSVFSVAHILHSPRNLGRLTNRDNEDVGAGEWPGIVSRELFEQANATIAARRTRGTSPPAKRGMLTGLIVCGECGTNLNRGRNARGPYYRCPGSSTTTACGKVGIIADFVEELTIAAVRERLSGHDAKLAPHGDVRDDARLARIDAELAGIDRRVEDLALRFADTHGASARALRLATERLEAQQRALLAERDTLRAVSPLRTLGNVDELMRNWDTLTNDQRHAVIEAVLHRITVAHVGHGRWPIETMRRRVTFG